MRTGRECEDFVGYRNQIQVQEAKVGLGCRNWVVLSRLGLRTVLSALTAPSGRLMGPS